MGGAASIIASFYHAGFQWEKKKEQVLVQSLQTATASKTRNSGKTVKTVARGGFYLA